MPTKLHRAYPGLMMFKCPGCGDAHGVSVKESEPPAHATNWDWNGSMKEPTFSPSVLSPGHPATEHCCEVPRCHSYVKNGMIEFLSDCTHSLAGQTVDLPDWPCESCVQGRIRSIDADGGPCPKCQPSAS